MQQSTPALSSGHLWNLTKGRVDNPGINNFRLASSFGDRSIALLFSVTTFLLLPLETSKTIKFCFPVLIHVKLMVNSMVVIGSIYTVF